MPLDQLVDNAHMLNSDSSGPDEGEDDMNEEDISSVNSVKSTPRPSKCRPEPPRTLTEVSTAMPSRLPMCVPRRNSEFP